MKLLSPVLGLLDNEPVIWCVGCQMLHRIHINEPNPVTGARWRWSGNVDCPTFSPSVNVSLGHSKVCHFYVQQGRIEYLRDSHHAFAGQHLPLAAIPADELD